MKFKIGMRRSVFIVLSIAWAVMIFFFSSRDADTSTGDSYWVGMKVGSIIIPDFNGWSEEKQLAFAEKVDHPIRKTAHATEYAIFAMLLLGAFYRRKEEQGQSQVDEKSQDVEQKTGVWKYRNFLLPWLVATIYAGTDEMHQLFVPGRSGQLSDVCLDSVGALVGLLIVLGIMRLKQRKTDK